MSTKPYNKAHVALCGAGLLLAAAAQASARDDSLGAWREYARRGVAPEYNWNIAPPVAAPTVLSTLREARTVARSALSSRLGTLSLNYTESPVGESATSLFSSESLLGRDRSLIQNQLVASSLERNIGATGQLEMTALVAHQRYASAGFGTTPWLAREDLAGLSGERPQELAAGHGVRVAYRAPLGKDVSWQLLLQSRMDMDAFKSYRGVYSDAGDFDIPGRAQARLQWDVTPSAALAFGVERVFYGDIEAFTSAALPTRFLSLLGDGSSPDFAWRDLTVYSLEGAVLDRFGSEWSLRYTTRQQPSPTSALLERALRPEYTNTNIALGYRRELGALGQLWLAASYAPSRYFLGATPYAQRDFDQGSQVEVEALWSVPF